MTNGLSSSTETLEENCNTVRDKARSLIDDLRETREAYLNARDGFVQELSKSSEQLEETHPEVETQISEFHEQQMGQLDQRTSDAFTEFEGLIPDLKEKVDESLESSGDEAEETIEALEVDVDALSGSVLENYKKSLNRLQEGVAEELKKFEEEITQFGDRTVDTLRDEIKETLAVSQTANQFLGGISPLLTGISAAKQVADMINDAM